MILGYVSAYLVSIVLGAIVVSLVVYLFHTHVLGFTRPWWRSIDMTIGCLERTISTTLVIWTPPLLPPFIGGWIALKFAANWGRSKEEHQTGGVRGDTVNGSLVFLIGNALSFSIAIGAGLLVNPEAVTIWATPS